MWLNKKHFENTVYEIHRKPVKSIKTFVQSIFVDKKCINVVSY